MQITFGVRAHCKFKFINLYFRENKAKMIFKGKKEFLVIFLDFYFKAGVLDVELLLLIDYDPPFMCFYTEPFKVMAFIAQSSKGKNHNFSCCARKNDFSFVDVAYVYNPRWALSPLPQMWYYSRERRFLSNILNFLKLSVI